MKESLRDEIRDMVKQEMRYLVYTNPERCEWWDLTEIVRLILCHLHLEPHTECKYPTNTLRSTIIEESKK